MKHDETPERPDRVRSAFYLHLKAAGAIARKNPELIRIARRTGYSVEHLFMLAIGRRKPSLSGALAIARETPKNKALTAESFFPVGE